MKIRIDDIRDKVKTLDEVEAISHYPSLAMLEEAGDCRFLEPLHITMQVGREYDHYRAAGHVDTKISLVCARCLARFETNISTSFTVFYTRTESEPQDEEVELAEEDLVSVFFRGDEIDFTPEIAEQVVLEVPFKPLCREDCAGLCSVCGVDLNISACGCERSGSNLKFSVLKDFKVTK